MFLDRDGNPIETKEFIEKLSDWNYTVVGKEKFPTAESNVLVLTIWTGLVAEENTFDDVPYIYETIIRGGEMSGYRVLYSDEFEAVTGHMHAVEMAKEKLAYGN